MVALRAQKDSDICLAYTNTTAPETGIQNGYREIVCSLLLNRFFWNTQYARAAVIRLVVLGMCVSVCVCGAVF